MRSILLSQFNFDESVLIKGVEAYAEIAKRSLKNPLKSSGDFFI